MRKCQGQTQPHFCANWRKAGILSYRPLIALCPAKGDPWGLQTLTLFKGRRVCTTTSEF